MEQPPFTPDPNEHLVRERVDRRIVPIASTDYLDTVEIYDDTYRCGNCTGVVWPEDKYCSECGSKLEWRL